MLSQKKSSLRDTFTQTADGNKQGAEPPGHPYHLVGLIQIVERDFPQVHYVGNISVSWLPDWLSFGVLVGCCVAWPFLRVLYAI